MMKTVLSILLATVLLVSCGKKETVRDEVFDPKEQLQKASELIKDDEFEEARKILFEVKNRDLSKKYAHIAQLKIAESYEVDEQPDVAIEEYRKFIRHYPDHSQAAYAQYQIAMIYFNQIEGPDKGAGGARKAMKEFQTLLKVYPRNQ
jgi:outer membrane protein assembly factor BamD